MDINNLPVKFEKYQPPDTEMDYSCLAIPKVYREKKKPKGLQSRTPLKAKARLKSHYEPIPLEVKKAVLEEKGSLCFLGFCPVCGGRAQVGINDDFHHFPHKSKGGQDIVLHLWPGRRECHSYLHDHPVDEKEMFREIESAGVPVVWKAEGKKIGGI